MSEKPVASIKTLARYEPDTVYIGTGEYVAECVRADDGDYYLAADVDAAIEALRAEVERLRADRDSWEQQASDRVADWYAEHLRAERLAEALRKLEEREQSDETLLRQALEALDSDHSDVQLRTAIALRERLGEGEPR